MQRWKWIVWSSQKNWRFNFKHWGATQYNDKEAKDTWWLPAGVFGILWNENENKQTNEHNNWTLFPICRTSARASLPPFSLLSFTWCMLTSKARAASRSTKPFNVSRTFSRPYNIFDIWPHAYIRRRHWYMLWHWLSNPGWGELLSVAGLLWRGHWRAP